MREPRATVCTRGSAAGTCQDPAPSDLWLQSQLRPAMVAVRPKNSNLEYIIKIKLNQFSLSSF